MPIEDEQVLVSELDGFGCVYILKRSKHREICKVGFTSVSARSRASEYTDGEWVVHKEHQMPLWLAKLVEKEAHVQLAEYWLDPKLTGGSATEVFLCSPEVAEVAIEIAKKEKTAEALAQLGAPRSIAKQLIEQISDSKHASSISQALEEANLRLSARISELEAANTTFRNELEILHLSQPQAIEEATKSLRDNISIILAENLRLKSKIDELLHPSLSAIEITAADLTRMDRNKIRYEDFAQLRNKFFEAVHLISKLQHKLRERS